LGDQQGAIAVAVSLLLLVLVLVLVLAVILSEAKDPDTAKLTGAVQIFSTTNHRCPLHGVTLLPSKRSVNVMSSNPIGEQNPTPDTHREPNVAISQGEPNIARPSSISSPSPCKSHREITCTVEKDFWDKAKTATEIFGIILLAIYTGFTVLMYCANKKAADAAKSAADTAQGQFKLYKQQVVGTTAAVVEVQTQHGQQIGSTLDFSTKVKLFRQMRLSNLALLAIPSPRFDLLESPQTIRKRSRNSLQEDGGNLTRSTLVYRQVTLLPKRKRSGLRGNIASITAMKVDSSSHFASFTSLRTRWLSMAELKTEADLMTANLSR
jgi:uncharacterized protein YpmB